MRRSGRRSPPSARSPSSARWTGGNTRRSSSRKTGMASRAYRLAAAAAEQRDRTEAEQPTRRSTGVAATGDLTCVLMLGRVVIGVVLVARIRAGVLVAVRRHRDR